MAQVIGIELFRALSNLARRYQFRNRDEICCYGLTASQCYALQVLHEFHKLASTQLAEHLGLDLSSTTRLIDALVRKRLVIRRRGASDGRIREIEITDNGQRLMRRIEDDFSKILATALADLPEAVQQSVPEVLNRLTQALRQRSGSCPAAIF
jgi:MarR family 2-MHQ and catechol resistance regulon transcriptional repressor